MSADHPDPGDLPTLTGLNDVYKAGRLCDKCRRTHRFFPRLLYLFGLTMLSELLIRNFAIIDDLHVRFSDGLTVLTGETGAGKSIVINAVNLILGGRATTRLIRTGTDSAELEAMFQVIPDSPLAKRMASHGYDASQGLLIKRIISTDGRHRAYLNGSLVTMQMLGAITRRLASISGQRSHQGLLKEERQLRVLDQFGGLGPSCERVGRHYNEVLPLSDRLKHRAQKNARQIDHLELLRFQKKEIADARTTPGEDIALEAERTRLKNAEKLYQIVYDSIESTYGAPGSVVESLGAVSKHLQRAARIDPDISGPADEIAETVLAIEDAVSSLRQYLKTARFDERRLESIEARLDLLQKLKRKYGGSLESVFEKMASIEDELASIENIPRDIEKVTLNLEACADKLSTAAKILSARRIKTAKKLAGRVEKELGELHMPQTRFGVDCKTVRADDGTDPHLIVDGNSVFETGVDRIAFTIAPNVGENLKPLSDIASGGELSRVVLAIKAILAKTESLETVVFDEVDAGIGGGTAEVVGQKLASLARYHQIICITHLPQIAAAGNHHFRISKQVSGGRTRTRITPLERKQRVREIARMLGGVKITQATLDHAKEMIQRPRR